MRCLYPFDMACVCCLCFCFKITLNVACSIYNKAIPFTCNLCFKAACYDLKTQICLKARSISFGIGLSSRINLSDQNPAPNLLFSLQSFQSLRPLQCTQKILKHSRIRQTSKPIIPSLLLTFRKGLILLQLQHGQQPTATDLEGGHNHLPPCL